MFLQELKQHVPKDSDIEKIVSRVLERNYPKKKSNMAYAVLMAFGKSDDLKEFFEIVNDKVVKLKRKDYQDILAEAVASSSSK